MPLACPLAPQSQTMFHVRVKRETSLGLDRETSPRCRHCGLPRTDDEKRKGYCRACYQRSYRGTLTAIPCGVCGEQWRAVLRVVELDDGAASLCGNHALVAGRRGWTLAELRAHCPDANDTSERRRAPSLSYTRGLRLDRRAS